MRERHKSLRQKRISLTATGALLGILALAGAAWACSVQPMVLGISPMTAAPGEDIRIEGSGVATAAPLEVHWNAASGPVIGQATADANRRFAVSINVPQAEPGIYTLVLVSQADGSLGRAAIEVTESAISRRPASQANSVSVDLWRGLSGESNSLTEPHTSAGSSVEGSRPFMAGAGLAATGLAALVGLTAVAAARRKRLARAEV